MDVDGLIDIGETHEMVKGRLERVMNTTLFGEFSTMGMHDLFPNGNIFMHIPDCES